MPLAKPPLVTLRLVCEIEGVATEAEAQAKLDAFREAVIPSLYYGIKLFRDWEAPAMIVPASPDTPTAPEEQDE